MDMMQGHKNRYPTNDIDHIIQFLNEKNFQKNSIYIIKFHMI